MRRASESVDVLHLDHDQRAIVLGILNDIIDDEVDAGAERLYTRPINPDPLRAITEEQRHERRAARQASSHRDARDRRERLLAIQRLGEEQAARERALQDVEVQGDAAPSGGTPPAQAVDA